MTHETVPYENVLPLANRNLGDDTVEINESMLVHTLTRLNTRSISKSQLSLEEHFPLHAPCPERLQFDLTETQLDTPDKL